MDALKVHLSEGKDVRANMWKAAEVSFMCSVPGLAACGVTHKMLAAVHCLAGGAVEPVQLSDREAHDLPSQLEQEALHQEEEQVVRERAAKSFFWVAVSSAPHFCCTPRYTRLEGISKYVKERSDDKIIPMSVEYEAEVRIEWRASQTKAAQCVDSSRVALNMCYVHNADPRSIKGLRPRGRRQAAEGVRCQECAAQDHQSRLLCTQRKCCVAWAMMSVLASLCCCHHPHHHHHQLLHFFTCGPDEVRAWTVRVRESARKCYCLCPWGSTPPHVLRRGLHTKQKGTLAPQAAGTIHTDFEKGFICADVYGYKTFKERTSIVSTAGSVKCGSHSKRGTPCEQLVLPRPR